MTVYVQTHDHDGIEFEVEQMSRRKQLEMRATVRHIMQAWLMSHIRDDGFVPEVQGAVRYGHPAIHYVKKSNEVRAMCTYCTPAGTTLTYLVTSYVSVRERKNDETNKSFD